MIERHSPAKCRDVPAQRNEPTYSLPKQSVTHVPGTTCYPCAWSFTACLRPLRAPLVPASILQATEHLSPLATPPFKTRVHTFAILDHIERSETDRHNAELAQRLVALGVALRAGGMLSAIDFDGQSQSRAVEIEGERAEGNSRRKRQPSARWRMTLHKRRWVLGMLHRSVRARRVAPGFVLRVPICSW